MTKKGRMFLSFSLLFSVIFSFLIPARAYETLRFSTPSSGFSTAVTDEGVFLFGFDGHHVEIEQLSPSRVGRTLTLSGEVISVSCAADRFSAATFDRARNQTVLFFYDFSEDRLESISLSSLRLWRNQRFGFDGSAVFFQDESDSRAVVRYASNGKKQNRFSFHSEVTALFQDTQSRVYAALSDGGLCRYQNGGFRRITGVSAKADSAFAAKNILMTKNTLFLINGDSGEKLLSFSGAAATCRGDVAYVARDQAIDAVSLSTKKTIGSVSFSGAEMLAPTASGILAVSARGETTVAFFDANAFKKQENAGSASSKNKGSNSNSQSKNASSKSAISSSTFSFDMQRNKITAIPAHTTAAAFRKKVSFDGSITFYKNGDPYKSGDLGTGMTAKFLSGAGERWFELSVKGDITGEGNVNRRDLKKLMRYLVGTIRFDGVYFTSADQNSDQKLDALDLALLSRRLD